MTHYSDARRELEAEGSPFAITTTMVRGVPLRTFVNAPANMRQIWEMSAGHGDKEYLVHEDERFTFAEIHAQVRKLADWLVESGAVRGSRVALSMRNYPEWVVGYWACVSLGVAVVGMNAWWTPAEMEYALGDSSPLVFIGDDERIERLGQLAPRNGMRTVTVRTSRSVPGSITWDQIMSRPDPGTLPAADIDPDDDATIFYTSGTTGFPKGAQLTHLGSVSNIMNIVAMTQASALADQKAIAAGELDPPAPKEPLPPVFFAPTPFFHVTACNCILHPATLAGAKVVTMHKWDPARALELIERERVTNFSGVPTMSREMLLHPDWSVRDTSSLQSMGGGGAAVQADLVRKIAGSVKNGQPGTGYGMTETCGIITANSGRLYLGKPESCGPVVPTLEAKLVDEDGNELPRDPETVGILCVRGAVVIKGYLNRPDATDETIKNGWLNTGDIARIDEDGFIFLVDRAKDMVIRGGENVYCSEVEAAIYQHDAIAEAAVFGVPDERLGEEVAAAILLRPGRQLSEGELRDFLSTTLARHKIPSRIWFRTEPIPRNANGKFVKRELRSELLGE